MVTENTKQFAFIAEGLKQRKAEGRLRSLRAYTLVEGTYVLSESNKLLNFSSNDYLGLSNHPALKARSIEFIENNGVSSTASRLICGNSPSFEKVEQKLATFRETETALILNSGFQANTSLIAALANSSSLILSDKYNHNSLIQGAHLSGGELVRYRHNDLNHLEQLLQKHASDPSYSRKFIITESIFGVDGDQVDIDALIRLANTYEAFLYVDDAHGMGVTGLNGMGLTSGKKGVDLTMGTFGKGGGSFGAYVSCSKELRDYLINFCPGLIYSTGLPPAALGAMDAALDLIPFLHEERARLQSNASFLRERLKKMDFDTGFSTTHIIPIIVGKESLATTLSTHLKNEGILAPAIRPPTVPSGTARIRICLSALHTVEQIELLLEAIGRWRE